MKCYWCNRKYGKIEKCVSTSDEDFAFHEKCLEEVIDRAASYGLDNLVDKLIASRDRFQDSESLLPMLSEVG